MVGGGDVDLGDGEVFFTHLQGGVSEDALEGVYISPIP